MSTKEQEAQQAQTIARVKLALNNGVAYTELKQFMRDMLEIVDSQAQKIAEQQERIKELENGLIKINQMADKAIKLLG